MNCFNYDNFMIFKLSTLLINKYENYEGHLSPYKAEPSRHPINE